MTNPTLERAARAAYDGHGFKPRDDMGGNLSFEELAAFQQENWRTAARAVLMAVLPTLERVEVEEQGPPGRGWLDGVSSSDGEYVRYEDLAAILAEGE